MIYVLLMILIAFLVASWRLGGPVKAIQYLSDRENKRIRTGVLVFAVLVPIAAALISQVADASERVRYLQWADVYLGVDNSGRISPQCMPSGPDRKTTSNGGLRINLIEYSRIAINAKYTHHSCAFNEDRNLYDAVGLEATFTIWRRR